jgi:hypothetical protein
LRRCNYRETRETDQQESDSFHKIIFHASFRRATTSRSVRAAMAVSCFTPVFPSSRANSNGVARLYLMQSRNFTLYRYGVVLVVQFAVVRNTESSFA